MVTHGYDPAKRFLEIPRLSTRVEKYYGGGVPGCIFI